VPDEPKPTPDLVHVLKIDAEQLDRLRPKTSGSTLEQILKVVQILAVVGAGFWTLYVFLSFGKRDAELSSQGQEVLKRVNEFELRQKTQYEQLQTELSISQQRLSLDQAKLALDVGKVSLKSGEQNLLFSMQGRLGMEQVLTIHKLSPGGAYPYEATLKGKFSNLSQAVMEISTIEIRAYVGSVTYGNPISVVRENPPLEDGPIRWTEVSSVTYYCMICTSKSAKEGYTKNKNGLLGGATGVLKSGESNDFEEDYFVNGKGDDFVGFTINTVTDRGRTYQGSPLEYSWITQRSSRLSD